jgi:hypothetical protein
MPEFLAETYTPRDGLGAPAPGDLAQAAAQASRPGAAVRFLGAVLLPAEETGFWLYQAPSAEAVRAAMTAAGLRPERITPALTIGPPGPPRSGGGAPAAGPPPRSRPH